MGALLVLALVVGWFIWRSGDSRLLWTRNYGATKVHAALSPKGEMVVAQSTPKANLSPLPTQHTNRHGNRKPGMLIPRCKCN